VRIYLVRWLLRGFKKVVHFVLPILPLPRRIEGGAWWLAVNDWVSDAIFEGTFERPQRRFVERFLGPGMVMFDVGAHHGLYSVIAATRVGPSGQVVAFEPSPRERRRMETHRRINRLEQMSIEPLGLGSEPGRASLFLPKRKDSGFNSMKPSDDLRASSDEIEVEISTLDEYISRRSIPRVDLIKIDVEGGELNVLKGGAHLLAGEGRPAILAEVEDERTEPWGYEAAEIVRALEEAGYRWFLPRPGGRLEPFETQRARFSHNLVAMPPERLDDVAPLIADPS
jgi:FkbM family methyltransferase